eukprot:g20786.t1
MSGRYWAYQSGSVKEQASVAELEPSPAQQWEKVSVTDWAPHLAS